MSSKVRVYSEARESYLTDLEGIKVDRMIRVIVADDYDLVRKGIRDLLDSADGIQVVGEAKDGETAVTLTQSLKPDVVVMDISMPVMDGFRATELIQTLEPRPHIVILSMHGSSTMVNRALRLGAKGYVLKRSATEELLPAVEAVKQGETYVSSTLDAPAAYR